MRNNPLRLAALLLGAAGTAAQAAGTLTIENPLAACVDIQPATRSTERGLILQDVTLEVKKPIGDCGCKSAIMGYTSQAVMEDGHRSFLQQGAIGARHSGARTLPLASDARLAGERAIVLSTGCSAPD